MVFATPLESVPHLQSGRLRALAVTGTRRLKVMADLPTIAESGVQGYEVSQWYGVLAPVGTPPQVLVALNRAFVQALRSPDLVDRFAKDGVDLVGSTPDQFRNHIDAEIKRFKVAITAAGIKLD